jgi:alpha-glucosidase
VILDEGWAVNRQADLMQVIPEIDIPELVAYGRERGVGIILWAGYHAFDRDMEEVCRHYAEIGVKGFKVDFMNRDDQQLVDFIYRAAETAAKYHLLLDFHGMYKPTGLNRTWPNVINFEGVHGLEQLKWSPETVDMVTYDVTIPFIRMVAGPMDYTQGAMRNAARGNYRPINSEPMSQGTRCHQLALYVVFNSPLNMLCDSPTEYMREPESLRFIASIPTVWDETVPLNGKVGEHVALARRSDDDWYIGGITGWESLDMTVDLSFLPAGQYEMTLFRDGANAHRKGIDYRKETRTVASGETITLHLAPGGGFAAHLRKI